MEEKEMKFKKDDVVICHAPLRGQEAEFKIGIVKAAYAFKKRAYLKQQGFMTVGEPMGEEYDAFQYQIEFTPTDIDLIDEEQLMGVSELFRNADFYKIKRKKQ